MDVKPGYKHTEVGVVPNDWEVCRLQEVCQRISVGLATSVTKNYRATGVPIVRNLNIRAGHFDASSMLYLATEFANANASKAARALDVLTVHTGANLGDTCVLPAEYDMCQTFTTLITTPKPTVLDSHFLCLHMCSAFGRAEMNRLQVGGGKGNLNTGDLKRYRVIIPPTKAEQEAIAGALSDADALIESLEQLVAKKRQIKHGAMQQLLTGQKRLPGFSGKWETKRLGEIGTFLKGSGVSKSQAMSGHLPCVRYGELYTRHNDYIKDFYSFISPEVALTATPLKRGDILFAGSGETKADIGKCVAFVHEIVAYAGGDLVILRTERDDPLFLGYCLNTPEIARQKASRGQGDAVVHISGTALSDIKGNFPMPDEQSAIAAVLSDIDEEIAEIEAKLAKARLVKQGMMQELLTGKTRLVKSRGTDV